MTKKKPGPHRTSGVDSSAEEVATDGHSLMRLADLTPRVVRVPLEDLWEAERVEQAAKERQR